MADFVKRRLQVFVSSTFTDLIEERQAAVGAILTAGHIPAGMELFTAGDESQMAVIKQWIDESDVYLLILGGRYGSIEPTTGKSYTHLEFEYAQEIGKPLFAVVADEDALEERVASGGGSKLLEMKHPKKLKEFRELVISERIVEFWKESRDIQLAVFKSMSTLDKREDLKGWVRPPDLDLSAVTAEMTRLSAENDRLREQLSATSGKTSLELAAELLGSKDSNLKELGLQRALEQRKESPDVISRLIRRAGLSNLTLVDVDFSGMDLRGVNLHGANLSSVDLSGVDLKRANLSRAEVGGANLEGADLSGAILSQAELVGANLEGADLHGANLEGVHLSYANLEGANLSEAAISFGADLRSANLRSANLSGASLKRTNLSGASLSGANLSGASLSGAKLSGASLSCANLSGANLSGIDLSGVSLSSANFEGASLAEANLGDAILNHVNLSGAYLFRASFNGADLINVNLRGAKLYGAKLAETRNLTQKQLISTCGDSETEIPEALQRPRHWLDERWRPSRGLQGCPPGTNGD